MTQMTDVAPTPLAAALHANIDYLRRELDEGRWTHLRFLRFRPRQELLDTLAIAEQIARDAAKEDPEVVDVEARVGEDDVVSTLRDALRIAAPANQIAPCPPGYVQPPYPLGLEDRERLYDEAGRLLQQQIGRLLPGGPEGWSWRVEPQVASDGSALLLRLTPRNERFEDPVVHEQTPEEQADAGAGTT